MSEITPASLLVLGEKRRPGRPRATEAKSALTAWVPTTYHDRLSKLAIKHDVSVSAIVCRVLEQALAASKKA